MTLRELYAALSAFLTDNPDHEALDQHVVVRVQTREDLGDELHCGGLRAVSVDAGCGDVASLVLDADQEPDAP